MRVIITGATGFIGAATLAKTLEHSSITKIVAYTRRPLSQKHPKLENIVQDNLDISEDDSTFIWCAGLKLGASLQDARALEDIALSEARKHGRFVYLSGMLAVKDQDANLWFASDARKLKGHSENQLTDEEHYIARPSMVVKDWSIPMTIRVDDLAAVLVDLAVNGNQKKSWNNSEIITRARGLN